jgi:fatty acid desaturase/nitrite reductase/ring-hydroxylating ferredoxin subunit
VLWLVLLVGAGSWAWVALGSWWAILAFAVYGALYGGAADPRWHECGHGTAFRTSWLNELVYIPASFMLLREPTVWRWSHARHHSDTIVVGRDAEIVFPRPIDVRAWAVNLLGLTSVPAMVRRIVRHACGRLDADVAGYVPSELHRRVVWVVTAGLVPLLFVVGPTFYGAWLMTFFGTTQHAGLREDVLDHRWNTRTVYMNPVFRFLYLNMNYHVEHHMFPTVPYRNLPALHGEIRDDLPEPSPSTWAAYREIWTAARGQAAEPTFELDRVVPESVSSTTRAATSVEHGEWIDVCAVTDLAPGAMRSIDGSDGPIVVCRASSGEMHAVAGICTHSRRVQLVDGAIVGDELECPKHNGRFRLADGSPSRQPVTEGLATYEVQIDADRIRVRSVPNQASGSTPV